MPRVVASVLQSAEVSVAVCYWNAVSASWAVSALGVVSASYRRVYWGGLVLETGDSSAAPYCVRQLREKSGSISVLSLGRG
jgi:hypothetical protein